jgi:hypothetical protein
MDTSWLFQNKKYRHQCESKYPNLRAERNVEQHHSRGAVVRVVCQNASFRVKAHPRRLHQSDEHEGDQRPKGHADVQTARLSKRKNNVFGVAFVAKG